MISVQSGSASGAPVKCKSWQRGNCWQEQRRWQQHGSQLIRASHYHACWVMVWHIRQPTAQSNSECLSASLCLIRYWKNNSKRFGCNQQASGLNEIVYNETATLHERTTTVSRPVTAAVSKWDNHVYLKHWIPQKCSVLHAKPFTITNSMWLSGKTQIARCL